MPVEIVAPVTAFALQPFPFDQPLEPQAHQPFAGRWRLDGGFQVDAAGGKQRHPGGGQAHLFGFSAAEGPCLVDQASHPNLPSRRR
ncbi:hypothetical protein [Nitratireductor alexandrii]|uniref:hypothetical protein n=1 Tax=Nitratireductor alexandrii TaxID=2448161 RepID=UPI0013048291|nr:MULTISPECIES: hypothetical protein [Nitratireductor]